MLVVLTGVDDLPALWLAHAFRQAGTPCTVVSVEALSFALRVTHRVSVEGVATRIELADGTALDDGELSGVVNRLSWPPTLAWSTATPAERDYATAELHALTVSWLTALPCPVRNRPAPDSLAGRVLAPLVAAAEAEEAGLDCPPLTVGTGLRAHPGSALRVAAEVAAGPTAFARQVLCLDAEVLSSQVPDDVRGAVSRLLLADGLRESLVGVDFVVGGGRWCFAGITPLPDLRLGGQRLVDRLLDVLAQPGRRPEAVRS